MPIFRAPLDRQAYIHVNTGGLCDVIPAGEVKELPDVFTQAAVAAGCTVIDPMSLYKGVPDPEPELDADVRENQIRVAIQSLVAKGSPQSFNALNGTPKVGPVSDLAGFKVTAAEITEIWETIAEVEVEAKTVGEDW